MPEMPALARTLCTSPPYRLFARRVLLPWALQGVVPSGEVLEIGSGSGAMAGEPFEDGCFDLVLSFAMLHHVGAWERAVAEAIRVLGPGGKFLGYDLIHSAPHRPGNQNRRHEGYEGGPGATRMMTAEELRTELGYLPVKDVRTRRAPILPALRFTATRA